MPNNAYSTDTTSFNTVTGEITSLTKIKHHRVASEPEYVKLYFSDIASLMHLTAPATKVLLALIKHLKYNNMAILSASVRDEMTKDMGYKKGSTSLKNSLSALVRSGIALNPNRNEYILDPRLFGRGKWNDIIANRKKFEMVVSYSEEGRKIKTNVDSGISNDGEESFFIDNDGMKVSLNE